MDGLAEAAQIVEELQEWIEVHDELGDVPQARLTWTNYTLEIAIGDIIVWSSEDGAPLTLELCREEFLRYVLVVQPFLSEATEIESIRKHWQKLEESDDP